MPAALLRLAYLGRGYHGSQYQLELPTVEGALRGALEGLASGAPRLASRTDRGVNALGNVALVPTDLAPAELAGRLGRRLAREELWVTGYAIAPDGFRPRRARRRYRYLLPLATLARAPGRAAAAVTATAADSPAAAGPGKPLTPRESPAVDRLREALALFVGEHDFRRFCRPEGATRATVTRIDVAPAPPFVAIVVEGRAFLWQQVRRMVGAASEVARGRRTNDDLAAALAGAEIGFGVAPPEFLTLLAVEYREVAFTPLPPPRRAAERGLRAAVEARFLRALGGEGET